MFPTVNMFPCFCVVKYGTIFRKPGTHERPHFLLYLEFCRLCFKIQINFMKGYIIRLQIFTFQVLSLSEIDDLLFVSLNLF